MSFGMAKNVYIAPSVYKLNWLSA